MLFKSHLWFALALRARAAAVAEPARVTVPADKAVEVSPATTKGPTEYELRKRQTQNIIEYLAPDNTCGYVDGSALDAIFCPTTASCAGLYDDPMLACCGPVSCATMPTVCSGYLAYLSATFLDADVLWCSRSAFPYCNGYTIPGLSKSVLFCTNTPQEQTIWDNLETTTGGDFVTALWETPGLTSPSSSTPTSEPSTTPSSSGSAGPASTSQSGFPTIIPQPDKKETPVAAIVGGTIGGVAVLALLIGGILFFLYKKKKQAQQDANPDYNNNYAPGVPPPRDGAMSPAPGYYATPGYGFGGGKQYDAKVTEPVVSPTSPPTSPPMAQTPLPYQVPVVVPAAQNNYRIPNQRGGNPVFEAA